MSSAGTFCLECADTAQGFPKVVGDFHGGSTESQGSLKVGETCGKFGVCTEYSIQAAAHFSKGKFRRGMSSLHSS